MGAVGGGSGKGLGVLSAVHEEANESGPSDGDDSRGRTSVAETASTSAVINNSNTTVRKRA